MKKVWLKSNSKLLFKNQMYIHQTSKTALDQFSCFSPSLHLRWKKCCSWAIPNFNSQNRCVPINGQKQLNWTNWAVFHHPHTLDEKIVVQEQSQILFRKPGVFPTKVKKINWTNQAVFHHPHTLDEKNVVQEQFQILFRKNRCIPIKCQKQLNWTN